MSQRPEQSGRIEKRCGSFSLLFYRDVPGSTKRQRVRRTLQATTMVAAKQEAQCIPDAKAANTTAHLEASRGPVVTFGVAGELWKSQQLHANGNHSSKRSMGCELDKHVLPHLKDTPIQRDHKPVYPKIGPGLKESRLGHQVHAKSFRHRAGRLQLLPRYGNEVVLLEPIGTKSHRKEVGAQAA